MIHDGILFHNVAQMDAVPGRPGLRLARLPDSVRLRLNPGAQDVALGPALCELRLVAGDPSAPPRVTLHSAEHHEYVTIFQGDFVHEEICLNPGETRTISLAPAPGPQSVSAAARAAGAFDPAVWRLRMSGTGRVHYISCAGDRRPPTADEQPRRTLAVHGSSITQGLGSQRLANPWCVVAARELGYDLLNLGSAGTCHAEEAMAEYLDQLGTWHACTIELGINIIDDRAYTTELFATRVERFIATLARSGRPVLLITPFTVHDDLRATPQGWRHPDELRQVVRLAHAASGTTNVHLIEGRDLLPGSGLGADLVHPSDHGHVTIGHRLARIAAQILGV